MTADAAEPADAPPADEGELIFKMGEFAARFPLDRSYCRNHLWLLPTGAEQGGEPVYRVGFTAYSRRLLQDVYFLDWTVDEGQTVPAGATIGEIESAKALSSMHPPAAGTITALNPAPLADPSVINAVGYDAGPDGGWLYDFATAAPLLDAAAYVAHLGSVWETTQRLIKGQANS
ncbi:glycine cleavage system protein H [Alienimonas californiensis]|uniref:Glycine cleavage system H protein n=1 Tax=Alienimonas californiensis TaxID=2527989 RepID=A0A517PA44_9PLAN|nr:glycine cleavage system protein H [Alienimonas californiensis]QDT16240.1 Glycine cleavage system H protein [Alienimonas californiensis]